MHMLHIAAETLYVEDPIIRFLLGVLFFLIQHWPYTLGGIILSPLVWAFVRTAWDKLDAPGDTPSRPTAAKAGHDEDALPFIEHPAKKDEIDDLANVLTWFFDGMRKVAFADLKSADLNIIQGATALARYEELGLLPPAVEVNLLYGCWQYTREGDTRKNGWHSVIFTPDNEWAVLGSTTERLLFGLVPKHHSGIPRYADWRATGRVTLESIDLLLEGMLALMSPYASPPEGLKIMSRETKKELHRQQRENTCSAVQRDLIDPFVAAMKKAGNPGLRSHWVQIEEYQKSHRMRCWYVGGEGNKDTRIYVLPSGMWYYEVPAQIIGRGGPGEHLDDSVHINPTQDFLYEVPDHVRHFIRTELTRYMRKHNVPLPKD